VDYCAAEVCGISGSNTGCTMFRGSVKSTGYALHSPVSPSLDGFDGVVVSMLTSGTPSSRVQTRPKSLDFSDI